MNRKMEEELNKNDLAFIIESLKYTILRFEEYDYPTQEYKQQRIEEARTVLAKVDKLKKEWNLLD